MAAPLDAEGLHVRSVHLLVSVILQVCYQCFFVPLLHWLHELSTGAEK